MSHPARNPVVIILILGSLSTISPFAIDMYLPAFQGIADALGMHAEPERISLTVSSYFAGLAAGQLLYGPLLDRFGRKPPLYLGLVLFVAASVLCAESRSLEWLMAMRFVQALGGCAAAVAAMAMVRDFFPVHETAKIISLLILILSVSPLLAPTIGALITTHLQWQWVFIVLAAFALFNIALCHWYLPGAHQADKSVSLKAGPIARNFWFVLKEPQFLTYAVSGAFAFSGLLAYVAGASVIFMNQYHVTAGQFSMIFGGLAIGFVGANQVNVLLLRKFSSDQVYWATLLVQCPTALLLVIGMAKGWFGLAPTLALLFVSLSSLGLAYPNAAALAMSPFSTNIGSASSMLGFLQISISAAASALPEKLGSNRMLAVALVMAATSWIGLAILMVGKRIVGEVKYVEEKDATQAGH